LPDNFQEARILAETIKSRTMRKTDEGITLTEELVAYYKKMLPPQQAYFVEYQIRYFLGEEVSEYLGLPKDLTQQNLVAFTNGIKEIQNLFSLPANQMPQLTANFQRMKATITNKNL
jgi:hypothetical protein